MPNRREHRRIFSASGDAYRLAEDEQRYEQLDDGIDELNLRLEWPIELNEAGDLLILGAGGSRMRRDRDSAIRRFRFRGDRGDTLLPNEDIFSPDNITQSPLDGLVLQAVSRATDFYRAEQQLDAAFLSADIYFGRWRGLFGLRHESNRQEAINRNPFVPDAPAQVGRIETRDWLPSAVLTWSYSEQAQLRLAYTETLSRPDFRELSPSPFTDPLLDESVVGNPALQPTAIRNLDLRWEYYFSSTDRLSLAWFEKRFDAPIERVSIASSGNLLTLQNAKAATNRGFEIDYVGSLDGLAEAGWLPSWLQGEAWRNLHLGLNYARIESSIELGDIDSILTHQQRPMQGQSPYVGNLSFGYTAPDGKLEATLLYNVAGARIVKVGSDGLPDFYEQAFKQLDFTLAWQLPMDGWTLKARLKNLLDPWALTTQGGEVTRRYRKGRELSLDLSWAF